MNLTNYESISVTWANYKESFEIVLIFYIAILCIIIFEGSCSQLFKTELKILLSLSQFWRAAVNFKQQHNSGVIISYFIFTNNQ